MKNLVLDSKLMLAFYGEPIKGSINLDLFRWFVKHDFLLSWIRKEIKPLLKFL